VDVGDSACWSGEELTHREHLVIVRIKGEQYACVGAPIGTSEECQLIGSRWLEG
jgi:hypothetical protein